MEFKEADITTVKNLVERNEGTGAVPAKVNDKIHENSKVSTSAASMAELTFADASITRMGANTQFSFQSKERLVKLEQGTVLIHTPPGNGGATVDCGGVTAAVSGTTFMASRDSGGNTMFVLLEGQGGLKVTVGGASTVIRPGQAASVGADAIQEAKKSAGDSGSGSTTGPGSSAKASSEENKAGGPGGAGSNTGSKGGGEGEGSPTPSAMPKIQVFEVDVKKVISTTPLIVEFKNELPSASKIEKTVEIQQKAVQDGKMEKLDVEVVAIKNKDGDVLVGAPKVEKEEMVVVNKKQELVGTGRGGTGNNLDVDTAAGPGAGTGAGPGGGTAAATPPPRTGPPVPGPVRTDPPPVNPGQIAGGTSGGQPAAPTSLAVTFASGSITVTLNRAAVSAGTVNFSDNFFPGLAIASGATTASFSFDPKNYFLGFDSGMNLVTTRPLAASLGSLSGSAIFRLNTAAIEAANPTRQLLLPPDATELAGLDAFFYFRGKAPGVAGGPDRFFAEANVGGADRTLTTAGGSITVQANQTWDLYAARKFTQGPGSLSLAPTGTPTESVYYATRMDLGAAFTEWGGLGNPEFDSSSLGFRYLTANANYLPVFDATIDPVTHEPMGFVDTFGGLLSPLENFPVWDDEKTTGNLGPNVLQTALNGFSNWSLVAGTEGFAARGLDLNANGSNFQILSAGDIHLQASRFSGVGSWVTTDPVLTLEALGKIKIGAETMTTDPNGQEIPYANRVAPQDVDGEALQVRLESAMPTGAGTPSPGQNIAVIRTGDSLELRNLTIRGFSQTTLEKLSPSTQVREGRVLISGSAVRDFKIKELVGAAVNADAKIQMMALDGTGALAGDMVVEGKMPVQAKIASALAGAGEVLPGGTANAMVDAKQIDLAARNLKFDNANLVAMNSITARANTILVQNSFMTVVRNQGMINMYVSSGLVNRAFGTEVAGRVNFDGLNTFTIGTTSFAIGNQTQLDAAYGNTLLDLTHNGGTPQAGKVNVLKL